MKDHQNSYTSKEEASQKEAYEIYDIWQGSTYWRYTSSDQDQTYGGNSYEAVPIERGSVTYDSNLEVSSLDVTFARSQNPVTEFVVQNPVTVLWIKVTRVFVDEDEVDIVFIGQIKNVSFKGLTAKANCVGFESYLKQPIPIYRYQQLCNWEVFDSKCSKDDTAFKTTTNLTEVSNDGLTLTSPDFASVDSNYYTSGKIIFGDDARMITYHVGSIIKVRFRIMYLVPGSEVTVYAGCDRNIETCRDKFDNVINFGGHPHIPLDNPVLWY